MEDNVTIQFTADRILRRDCEDIYNAMGMDLETAFRMFMERTRMVRGLPFPAVLPKTRVTRSEALAAFQNLRQAVADVPEMTLDEINAEIDAARTEMERKRIECRYTR